jgi:hypothetical protein
VTREGRADRAHDLAAGQQPVRDVQGHAALHGHATQPLRRPRPSGGAGRSACASSWAGPST